LPELIYSVYGASVAEVEVDILTGESRVLGVTLMMDSGPLLNPAIDIGQAEGAFVMGLGQWMLEGANWDPATGRLLSDNTWTYKVPTMYDTPQEFDVQMIDFQGQRATNGWSGAFAFAKMVAPMPYKPHASEVHGYNRSSRALGEPPLLMSCAIHSALRQAVSAARCPIDGSADPNPNFNMPAPATPEAVSELCWTGSLSALLRSSGSGAVEHVAEAVRGRSKTQHTKSVTIHPKDTKPGTGATVEQKEPPKSAETTTQAATLEQKEPPKSAETTSQAVSTNIQQAPASSPENTSQPPAANPVDAQPNPSAAQNDVSS
jgi:hypothetical protein